MSFVSKNSVAVIFNVRQFLMFLIVEDLHM